MESTKNEKSALLLKSRKNKNDFSDTVIATDNVDDCQYFNANKKLCEKPSRKSQQIFGKFCSLTTIQKSGQICLIRIPGLLIVVLINLLQSFATGLAYFPSTWIFPDDIPRTIGCQMFLFSTLICQIILTTFSEFPTAAGMQMIENTPFTQAICRIAISFQGTGRHTFSTVIVAFGLSSILVGVFFFLLGYFKLGNFVSQFPKYLITGCIGGIGIFLIITGLEVSTGVQWIWSYEGIKYYFSDKIKFLWISAVILEIILMLLLKMTKIYILPPFYFISIPAVMYIVLYISGISLGTAHEHHWFYEAQPVAKFTLMWDLFDFREINWNAIGHMFPTFISLTIFSLMHVPINIPSLSMSTGKDVEMNRELIAHGYSNAIAGLFGGLQNYICYCNSLLYFKCHGGGKISGYLVAAFTAILMAYGPVIVYYVPRCMAGNILLHIGITLSREALLDSYHSFDKFEYGSVLLIMVSMTAYGMTIGLAVGVFCAAVTLTLQIYTQVQPIRDMFVLATSLASSKARSNADTMMLQQQNQSILIIELQGIIFFGNSITINTKLEKYLETNKEKIKYILVDFTLVLAIDSNAADSLFKLHSICKKYGAKLCYSLGSRKGFSSMTPIMSARLLTLKKLEEAKSDEERAYHEVSHTLHITDSLDEGLQWCEDDIIASTLPPISLLQKEDEMSDYLYQSSLAPIHSYQDNSRYTTTTMTSSSNIAIHIINKYYTLSQLSKTSGCLKVLQSLCPGETSDILKQLASYFTEEVYPKGLVLWRQGQAADRLLLIGKGRFSGNINSIIMGGYELITNSTYQHTIIVDEEVTVYILSKEKYESMIQHTAYLALLLSISIMKIITT